MLLYATARPRTEILKFQVAELALKIALLSSISKCFYFQSNGTNSEYIDYLHITPDRSLVFTAIEYFMSMVRKASALHPAVPVVIDLSHVSIADFSTAYVRRTLYPSIRLLFNYHFL